MFHLCEVTEEEMRERAERRNNPGFGSGSSYSARTTLSRTDASGSPLLGPDLPLFEPPSRSRERPTSRHSDRLPIAGPMVMARWIAVARHHRVPNPLQFLQPSVRRHAVGWSPSCPTRFQLAHARTRDAASVVRLAPSIGECVARRAPYRVAGHRRDPIGIACKAVCR